MLIESVEREVEKEIGECDEVWYEEDGSEKDAGDRIKCVFIKSVGLG